MIYSILREDQYHVIGKTTGTDASCIGLQRKNILSLKPQGANIGEQRDIVQK